MYNQCLDRNRAVGSCGRAHFRTRTYTGKDRQTHLINEPDSFIDYKKEFEGARSATKPEDIAQQYLSTASAVTGKQEVKYAAHRR